MKTKATVTVGLKAWKAALEEMEEDLRILRVCKVRPRNDEKRKIHNNIAGGISLCISILRKHMPKSRKE